MRFAANVSMLFPELDLPDRILAARDAGFSGVEILFPYDLPAREILLALQRADLPLALINTPPPNWTGGARGFAAIPGGEDRFRHDFKRALRYAGVLGADLVHVMAGVASGSEARATMIRNLEWAVSHAPKQRLTIEPINTRDMPGYFLDSFALAEEIINAVSAPNLALQFDAYHPHNITGDLLGTWKAYRHLVGHVQFAGAPGRHEPQHGDANILQFFETLKKDGYGHWISAEYNPKGATEAGLGWLRDQRERTG